MFYNIKNRKIIINEAYMDEAAQEIEQILKYKLNELGFNAFNIKVGFDPNASDEDDEIHWFGMTIYVVDDNEMEIISMIDFASMDMNPQLVWIDNSFEFFRSFFLVTHTLRSFKTLKPVKTPNNSLEKRLADALLEENSEKIIINILDFRKEVN